MMATLHRKGIPAFEHFFYAPFTLTKSKKHFQLKKRLQVQARQSLLRAPLAAGWALTEHSGLARTDKGQ